MYAFGCTRNIFSVFLSRYSMIMECLGFIFKKRHHSFRRFAEREEGENVQSDRRGKKQHVQPGILRQNVTLVQKSSKTSVEQSFFAGCPFGKM
jgi:hypothetical protein